MNGGNVLQRTPIAAAAGIALLALILAALIWLPVVALANSPPATPASVTLSRSGATLTIVWDTPAGATKYHVTYSSDNRNSWTAIGDNLTGNGIGVGNTDPAKTYIVAVRAGNEHGWSGWRNSAPIAPNPPPAAPGTIAITRANGSLAAQWDAVADATKYHVTYSSNNRQSWQSPVCGDNCSNNVTITADNQKTYIVAGGVGVADADAVAGQVVADGGPAIAAIGAIGGMVLRSPGGGVPYYGKGVAAAGYRYGGRRSRRRIRQRDRRQPDQPSQHHRQQGHAGRRRDWCPSEDAFADHSSPSSERPGPSRRRAHYHTIRHYTP